MTADRANDLFFHGGCLSFAIALQKKLGGDIYVLERDGKQAHAYLKTPHGNYDVEGKRGTYKMVLDVWGSGDRVKSVGPVDPKDAKLKPATPTLIKKAEEYIEQNSSKFK